ncbi:hypothetical protein [Kitasatospora sp. NPDC050463]|uniref:helix-turn-helix transcriptional regulator n=1 Tax=Kitasatospora sp. NPDC050463 TaxID=3155786 RepID=UPI00340770F8
MTAGPLPELSEAERQLITLVAQGNSASQIAAAPGSSKDTEAAREAIQALFAKTGTRTVPHLAAWAAAHRIVTEPVRPTGALSVKPQLPPRLAQILRGWSGGRTTPELTADFGISPATMRSYIKTLFTYLGVDSQPQAGVVGVLAGLVRLSDIDPSWPAEPLASAVGSGAAR